MNFNWIDDFITNEVLTYDSEINENELYVKSCCEYILYCYQLKKHENILSKQKKKILKKIANCNQIIYCKHILELCLFDKTNKPLEKYPDSIEFFYVLDLMQGKSNIKFWNSVLSIFFRRISKNGITEIEAYNLTHYIFYSTNFGEKCEIFELNIDLKTFLLSLINLCIMKFEYEKNWDLCFELYICLLIVDSQYEIISKKINANLLTFVSNQGWILSNGNNKSYFEKNYHNLTFKQKYSLFHTTLLFELLNVKIKN